MGSDWNVKGCSDVYTPGSLVGRGLMKPSPWVMWSWTAGCLQLVPILLGATIKALFFFWDVSVSNVMQLNEVICVALLHCRLLQESRREKAPPELLRLERQAACNLLPSFPLGFLYGASEIKPWALSPGVTGVSSPNSLICERTFFNFVLF